MSLLYYNSHYRPKMFNNYDTLILYFLHTKWDLSLKKRNGSHPLASSGHDRPCGRRVGR